MSRTLKRVLIGVVAAGILVLLALPKLTASRGEAGGQTAMSSQQQSAPLGVSTFVVEETSLQDKIVTTGTVLANEEVELRPETSGRITQIAFREGRPVQAGALLVKINDSELQAQRRRAERRLELAEERAFRQERLLEKGGVSQEEYDATVSEVDVLRAEVELIEAQIDKTEIRAPFSGLIGLRYASEGSYVSPATRIATLQSLNPAKIEFSVPEKYAAQVGLGDAITFTVEGVDGAFEGEIYAFEPQIEAGTRTLAVRARSPNPQGRLLPGAFADIEVVLSEVSDALTVPAIAVIPEQGGNRVYLYEGGTAQPRSVETGIRMADRVQITEGLAPADTIILTGLQQLRPGLPVQVTRTSEG